MRAFIYLLLTFIGLIGFCFFWSSLFRPDVETEAIPYSEEERVEVEQARQVVFTPEDREPLWVDVDYSQGESAAWYPKGESPLLVELVDEGKLPPVAERVGPEPVVYRGVDGIGAYGGTLVTARNSKRNAGTFGTFYAGDLLVRFSPTGEPVVPHIAKSWEIRDGGREYIFHLRRGMRWSDGHPFTADDIVYYWNHEKQDPDVSTPSRKLMLHRGKEGTIEKIDDYTVAFRFEDPNSLLLGRLAGPDGKEICGSPAHYLRQYHPTLGDPEVIEAAMAAWQMPSRRALYSKLKEWDNPEHPRHWPFVFRSWKGTPPYSWVRNPYYYAVDVEGNQLPYIDRYLITLKNQDLIPIAASNGELPLTGVSMEHYTILMANREKHNYKIFYHGSGDGSPATIFPNMTKRRTEREPDADKKEALFRTKEFRQALSLAINREAIIEVEFGGLANAAQVGPGPNSPLFNPDLYHAFTDHDPERANRLLDSIGLTRRDAEGYRTFRDGSTMTFYIIYISGGSISGAMLQSVVEDWAAVGIRAIFKERGTNLFWTEVEGMLFDFMVAGVGGEQFAIYSPRLHVPNRSSFHAYAWGYWYMRGGYYGAEVKDETNTVGPPPDGHPFLEAMDRYDEVIQTLDREKRIDDFKEILDITAEHLWHISISDSPPTMTVVSNELMNVPERAVKAWQMLTPSNTAWETISFRNPTETEAARAQMQESILSPLGSPPSAGGETVGAAGDELVEVSSKGLPSWLNRVLVLGLLAGVLYLGFIYPFIGRRLLLMVPTLFVVSLLVFLIIELPPGDYSTSMIAQAQAMGEESDLQKIEEVQRIFMLNESWVTRYMHWSGLQWFTSFSREDRGLLQGDLGRSMENMEPVTAVMGDRALLTFIISLGTVLFTWVVALPIGIFSAVKQYSLLDYVFTIIGFLGMCVPNFLLAILLMYFSTTFLGINVSGLFSSEYAGQPNWTFGKFVDLMQHLWVPVVVIGTAGTASMIRVMRGNLLDELKKPYVTTARAKGVRPVKLILKYPVRLALNPFISGVGHIFPQLISGGAIVALILSLPTVGPLLLESLLLEDMYLAGSLLMILSALGIVGTLVSDLLLMVLDPRIRMGGGSR